MHLVLNVNSIATLLLKLWVVGILQVRDAEAIFPFLLAVSYRRVLIGAVKLPPGEELNEWIAANSK